MNTSQLKVGDLVMTTEEDGNDFGLPLVSPTHKPGNGAVVRKVRNRCRVRGGTVVWFEDGTKSRVVHGRTEWLSQS